MANPFTVGVPDIMPALDSFEKDMEKRQQRALFSEVGNEISRTGGIGAGTIAKLYSLGPSAAPLITAAATLGKQDTTDELKEYGVAKKQGYAGSFMDYKTALKKAGATSVNVNTGEKSYDKVLGEESAKRFIDLQKGGANAAKTLPTLDAMEGFIQDPGFYSGPLAENLVLPLKRGIAALGGDPNGAASMEAFRSQSNKAVVDSLGSLGAGVSNADVSFLGSTVPSLANTPEGNKQLIGIMRKVEARKQDVAKLARDYARENKGRVDAGFDEALARWAEKNPLFDQGTRDSFRRSQTDMSGARVAPDGNTYMPDPNRPGKYLKVVR